MFGMNDMFADMLKKQLIPEIEKVLKSDDVQNIIKTVVDHVTTVNNTLARIEAQNLSILEKLNERSED